MEMGFLLMGSPVWKELANFFGVEKFLVVSVNDDGYVCLFLFLKG